MSWNAKLEFAPVPLPDGRKLETLDDARAYLLERGGNSHNEKAAAGELLKAAEKPNQFTCHCARQAVSRAVWGDGRSERAPKSTWRDKRKKARRG